MDWYYGRGAYDCLVPKDEDILDRNPSQDSWSKWERSTPEGFNSPKSFLTMDSNATEAEFNFIDGSFKNEVGSEPSPYDKDQSSSSSACGGGFPEQSFQQQTALLRDQPEYQLQELSSFEQMDDIFLDSVLEDFPSVENLHNSFYFYPENECSNTPGGLQKDIAALALVPCNSDSKDCLDMEAQTDKVLDPSEQFSEDEVMHKQSSIEESTLQDLEMIISQFTGKTRICFRDALYRLARNTKQHDEVEDLDGDLNMQQAMPWEVNNENMRSENDKPMESETNSVDRAVANLMFNKMEANMLETPVNFKQEVTGTEGGQGESSKALDVAQKLPEYALRFGQSDQQTTTESHASYADSINDSFMQELG